MPSLVVLAASRFREMACAELSAQFEFTKRHHGLWVPSEILGMWVGPEPDFVSASIQEAHVPPRRPTLRLSVESAYGIAGRWTMFLLEESSLTRACLLDKLVASGAQLRDRREPRFIPVFPTLMPDHVRRAELAQLRARHPDEVCLPLLMNSMTGLLRPALEAS